MFHALTGCDTVSFFSGRGKKTVWDVWKVFPELTPVLKAMLMLPEDIDHTFLDVIERFVIFVTARATSVKSMKSAKSFSHPSHSSTSMTTC